MDTKTKAEILKLREFKDRAAVVAWMLSLFNAGLNYHPDDTDYIDLDNASRPTFNKEEVTALQLLNLEAWKTLGDEIYEASCEAWEAWAAQSGLFASMTAEAELKIPDALNPLQRAARAVLLYLVDPHSADHTGFSKREAIEALANAVGLPADGFITAEIEDEEE